MNIIKRCAYFCIGGSAYVGLELLYRGRSHISMFAAGGTCFLLVGALGKKNIHLLAKAPVGAGIITAVELATGLLVNRDYAVWDYRHQPGNFMGQICPQFIAVWAPLSLTAMGLYGWLDRKWDALTAGRRGTEDFP